MPVTWRWAEAKRFARVLIAVLIKSLPARRNIKANMNKIQRETPAPSPGFLVDNQSRFLHTPQSFQRVHRSHLPKALL